MTTEESPHGLYHPETESERALYDEANAAISAAVAKAARDGSDPEIAWEKHVSPVLALQKYDKLGARDTAVRDGTHAQVKREIEKLETVRVVGVAMQARSAAAKRVALCKKPASLKAAQEEYAKADAAYREAAKKRDAAYGRGELVEPKDDEPGDEPDEPDEGDEDEEKPAAKSRVAIFFEVDGLDEETALEVLDGALNTGAIQDAIRERAEFAEAGEFTITDAKSGVPVEKTVAVQLTKAELHLVLEGLDGYRYWQLSDDVYRHDGFVMDPGSDDEEKREEIAEVDCLESRLEAIQKEAFGS